MKRIGCVGDNCVDHYRQTGEDHFGGNPVNVAVYTRRLGGGISYVGAVGTDGRGAALLDALRRRGVDVSHVHVDEGSTAVTYVEHINGDRVFGDYDEGVMAQFALTEEDIAFLRAQGYAAFMVIWVAIAVYSFGAIRAYWERLKPHAR